MIPSFGQRDPMARRGSRWRARRIFFTMDPGNQWTLRHAVASIVRPRPMAFLLDLALGSNCIEA